LRAERPQTLAPTAGILERRGVIGGKLGPALAVLIDQCQAETAAAQVDAQAQCVVRRQRDQRWPA